MTLKELSQLRILENYLFKSIGQKNQYYIWISELLYKYDKNWGAEVEERMYERNMCWNCSDIIIPNGVIFKGGKKYCPECAIGFSQDLSQY